MKNPQDPRFTPQPGNRLFRSVAQQRQKRGAKVSSLAIAAAITVLFVASGGAFYYLARPAAPPQIESAAPAPTPTTSTLAQVTPSPTPATRARSEAESGSRKKSPPNKTALPLKEVKAPRTIVEGKKSASESERESATETKSDKRETETAARSSEEKPAETKAGTRASTTKARASAASKPSGKKKTAERASTATKKGGSTQANATKAGSTKTAGKAPASRTPARSETASRTAAKKKSAEEPAVPINETVVVPVGDAGGAGDPPQSAPLNRVKFNMRPDSERSANTDRVNRLEEFPDAPADNAPAAPARQPAARSRKAAPAAGVTLPPPPEVPLADDSGGKGRQQSALEGAPGLEGPEVALNAPAAPARPSEDYAVQYLGPEVLRPAPVVRGATRPYPAPRQAYGRPMPPPARQLPAVPVKSEARQMAKELRRIEGVEVQVVPN